jgi:hypothetical protein
MSTKEPSTLTVKASELLPGMLNWIRRPVIVKLSPPTIKTVLEPELYAPKADYRYYVNTLFSFCTPRWALKTREVTVNVVRSILSLTSSLDDQPALQFVCGFKLTDGEISDWNVSTAELQDLFSDMPIITWNVSGSKHHIYKKDIRSGLNIPETTTITVAHLLTIYAIIYKRLELAGADMSLAEAPTADISALLPIPGVYLPITSPYYFGPIREEEIKTFLSRTFKNLVSVDYNKHRQGLETTSWKLTSQIEEKSTENTYYELTSNDGLVVQVQEQGSKLMITHITGLISYPPSTALLDGIATDFI